jgi:hypothetical protein
MPPPAGRGRSQTRTRPGTAPSSIRLNSRAIFLSLPQTHAQESFRSFGLVELLGADHIFHSVEEAVRSLGGKRRGGQS